MDLEAFELVLLRRPENPPDYDDAELELIQREHLAHHARLRASALRGSPSCCSTKTAGAGINC